MNLEGIGLSEISQTEKEKYCIWYQLYMESLKKRMKKKEVELTDKL